VLRDAPTLYWEPAHFKNIIVGHPALKGVAISLTAFCRLIRLHGIDRRPDVGSVMASGSGLCRRFQPVLSV